MYLFRGKSNYNSQKYYKNILTTTEINNRGSYIAKTPYKFSTNAITKHNSQTQHKDKLISQIQTMQWSYS